jgi:hypothetical protein
MAPATTLKMRLAIRSPVIFFALVNGHTIPIFSLYTNVLKIDIEVN